MKHLSRRGFLATTGAAAVGSRARASAQSSPKLTLAGADYLRFTPLATGDMKPEGIDLTWLRGPRSDMLRRATSDPDVDGGETSMLGHLLRVDQGDRSLVAVPVFPLRNFTVRDIYVRQGSGLTVETLAGRRVGIYNWAASGAVWYRQLVRYLGHDPARMTWLVGGINEPSKVQHRAPLPSYVGDAPADKSLADLLIDGEIDAMFAPLPPTHYDAVEGPIARLVPDYRPVERRYYEATSCFPPQHVLVIRRQTWERDPSIGSRLVETFQQCENLFQDGIHLFPYSTPWMTAEVEETDLLMGRDFHAHGLDKNRAQVDLFCQSGYEDGLTERRVTVDQYFADFLNA